MHFFKAILTVALLAFLSVSVAPSVPGGDNHVDSINLQVRNP
jgi:hypothetical protein